MTYKEKLKLDHPGYSEDIIEDIIDDECPMYRYIVASEDDFLSECHLGCINCWNKEIPAEFLKEETEPSAPHILDSGARRSFDTGAVRDSHEGKGRCDLLPMDIVANYLQDEVLINIHEFQRTGDIIHLYSAIKEFMDYFDSCPFTMLLEVSIQFEEGARKYDENNWRKGIPVRCYIDSAVRHYLKFSRGDNDERHDRAFVWNLLCAIWTCKHKPELNDYRKD